MIYLVRQHAEAESAKWKSKTESLLKKLIEKQDHVAAIQKQMEAEYEHRKKVVKKTMPFYEYKIEMETKLEELAAEVTKHRSQLEQAKRNYREALDQLEVLSNAIHVKRTSVERMESLAEEKRNSSSGNLLSALHDATSGSSNVFNTSEVDNSALSTSLDIGDDTVPVEDHPMNQSIKTDDQNEEILTVEIEEQKTNLRRVSFTISDENSLETPKSEQISVLSSRFQSASLEDPPNPFETPEPELPPENLEEINSIPNPFDVEENSSTLSSTPPAPPRKLKSTTSDEVEKVPNSIDQLIDAFSDEEAV